MIDLSEASEGSRLMRSHGRSMEATLRYADAGVIVDDFTTQCAFTTISAGALRGGSGYAHAHLRRRRDLRLPGAKARAGNA